MEHVVGRLKDIFDIFSFGVPTCFRAPVFKKTRAVDLLSLLLPLATKAKSKGRLNSLCRAALLNTRDTVRNRQHKILNLVSELSYTSFYLLGVELNWGKSSRVVISSLRTKPWSSKC